jgi:hypothetical protein
MDEKSSCALAAFYSVFVVAKRLIATQRERPFSSKIGLIQGQAAVTSATERRAEHNETLSGVSTPFLVRCFVRCTCRYIYRWGTVPGNHQVKMWQCGEIMRRETSRLGDRAEWIPSRPDVYGNQSRKFFWLFSQYI